MSHRYLLGIGANIYSGGPPSRTVERALEELEREGAGVVARSHIVASRPLGPGRRDYANAAAIVKCAYEPPALLQLIRGIENHIGRRRGRRWGDRKIDIDILFWSGGTWSDRALAIPHPALRQRRFVLAPLAEIAPGWRDPVTGLSIRQLNHRLHANSPVDRTPAHP